MSNPGKTRLACGAQVGMITRLQALSTMWNIKEGRADIRYHFFPTRGIMMVGIYRTHDDPGGNIDSADRCTRKLLGRAAECFREMDRKTVIIAVFKWVLRMYHYDVFK